MMLLIWGHRLLQLGYSFVEPANVLPLQLYIITYVRNAVSFIRGRPNNGANLGILRWSALANADAHKADKKINKQIGLMSASVQIVFDKKMQNAD